MGKIFLATLFLFGCIDSYTPPSTIQNYGYLVVDGVLDTGGDTIRFTLSHTQPLSSVDSPVPETGATISIQEENGSSYNMISDGAGNYKLSPGLLNVAKNLRMHIVASDGKEYVSPYVTPTITPPIDSISFPRDNTGNIIKATINNVDVLPIFVNTHDPSNKAKFFLWKFEETWQYDAKAGSTLLQINGDSIIQRSPDQLINTCYMTVPSTNILIYSTTDLSQDIVSEFPLLYIPMTSIKLNIRYSIVVHQYALSVDAYQYWLNIQKNTENLGSIFGSLPVQVTGNFTCVTDPSIPVLGFFSATAAQDKRVFITAQQLPLYNRTDPFYNGCQFPDSINVATSKIPQVELFLSPIFHQTTLIGYTIGPVSCADCRVHGGTLTPPSFW